MVMPICLRGFDIILYLDQVLIVAIIGGRTKGRCRISAVRDEYVPAISKDVAPSNIKRAGLGDLFSV